MTKTKITKILNDCKFNPRKPGPLKVVADVGDTDYYIKRAIEILTSEANTLGKDKEYMKRAISLIALAIANEET